MMTLGEDSTVTDRPVADSADCKLVADDSTPLVSWLLVAIASAYSTVICAVQSTDATVSVSEMSDVLTSALSASTRLIASRFVTS